MYGAKLVIIFRKNNDLYTFGYRQNARLAFFLPFDLLFLAYRGMLRRYIAPGVAHLRGGRHLSWRLRC